MDWYLEPDQPAGVSALRREIGEYLRRHAAEAQPVEDAELAVAELLSNTLRHSAGPSWVTLTWSGQHPVMVVRDLGPDFDISTDLPGDLLSEHGRGLFIVSGVAGGPRRQARPAGGNEVKAVLPVRRRAEVSYDPGRSTVNALPALDEAQAAGGFDRATFLRALVVELAQAVEAIHGPAAAEAAVARVGARVGGQMEVEYRLARATVERLTPEQMADCYVRLKAAIDGDFYVIEVTPERIVLGNRACPFGEVVKRAPALCRMTSSVFGGIASRNAGGASVVLEERIAVGDPQCRVSVYLGPSPADTRDAAHRYAGTS